jgi:hypothetical protein
VLLVVIRFVLPAVICLAGLGILVFGHGAAAIEGAAMMAGAGLSVALINVPVRMGNDGERDREREEAARRYLDRHGHWPDERPPRR